MTAPARRWLGSLLPAREAAGPQRAAAAPREDHAASLSRAPASGRWAWGPSFRSVDDNQESVHNAFAGLEYLPPAGPPSIAVLSGHAGAAEIIEGEGSTRQSPSAASAADGAGRPAPSLGGRSSRRGGYERSAAHRAASLHVQSALAVRDPARAALPHDRIVLAARVAPERGPRRLSSPLLFGA